MSLNGFGSTDSSQNVSGSQMSAAESGNFSGFSGTGGGGGPELPPGVDRKPSKTAQDIRSAFIAAGGGQRVNPGFFDSRNTVSPAELARARAFNPAAFKATRGGGLMNLITGGGIFGNLIRGLGQRFGLGKTYNQPTYDVSGLSGLPFGGTAAFQNLDIRDKFNRTEEDDEEDDTQLFNFGDTTVPSSSYDMAGVNTPFAQQAPEEFVSQFLPETDIYNQQTTRYQKRPEQVETDIFFSPELKSEDNLMTNSDVAPEFQNMIMRASGTIGNYAQNAVSNQLYGKDYAVLDPFEQQQIDTAIETYGTKSTGELASGTEI
jgi:hypothetical protein